MLNGYRFIDSLARSKEFSTWAYPPQDLIDKIRVGWFVQVGVEPEVDSPGITRERFWAQVTAITPPPEVQVDVRRDYDATINNDLTLTDRHGLVDLDHIVVQQKHFLKVLPPKDPMDEWLIRMQNHAASCTECTEMFFCPEGLNILQAGPFGIAINTVVYARKVFVDKKLEPLGEQGPCQLRFYPAPVNIQVRTQSTEKGSGFSALQKREVLLVAACVRENNL